MLGGKKSKIVKALKWRIWEFRLSPKNSSSSFTSCSSFLKSLVGCLSSLNVRLAGPGPGAVLAGGLFAVSRLSWQWSMVAEVFTLNNLFVGLLFVLIASFHGAENATQRRRVTHSDSFPVCLIRSVLDINVFFQLHHTKMFHLVRLHTGERCAVVWGCVTSTHWCCTCWSSFPGSFTNYTLIG